MFSNGATADMEMQSVEADEQFDASAGGPIQMVVRWTSADEIDLVGIIFDTSATFMEAAY